MFWRIVKTLLFTGILCEGAALGFADTLRMTAAALLHYTAKKRTASEGGPYKCDLT